MTHACTFLKERTGFPTVRRGTNRTYGSPCSPGRKNGGRFSTHMADEPYVRFAGATRPPKRRTFWEARHGRRPAVVARDPKRRFNAVLAPGGAMEHGSSSRRPVVDWSCSLPRTRTRYVNRYVRTYIGTYVALERASSARPAVRKRPPSRTQFLGTCTGWGLGEIG